MLRSNQQDDKWEKPTEHHQSQDRRAESRTGSAITGEAPAHRPGGYITNVGINHLLFLFMIGLSTLAGAGCGSSCPLDADGDGTITEEELSAFTPPSDPAELVGLFLGCQSLLEQLGLNSLDQLGSTSPEQLGLNSPTIIDMPTDRTVNEGEVFVVDASLMISGEGEVDLWVTSGNFAVNRTDPLRWEVTAPLLGERDETLSGQLNIVADPLYSDSGEVTDGNVLAWFQVTVVNTNIAADRLSGWWSFSPCSSTCRMHFRFDGSGTLVDWRWHETSNDPEVFIPQWQDVAFSGTISESGASIEFSGRFWRPRWRNVQELERDPSAFPGDSVGVRVVDSLSPSDKQDIVRRVGTMEHITFSFATSREPPLLREGPMMLHQSSQDTHVLLVCDNAGCRIISFSEDIPWEWDSRDWSSVLKFEDVSP